MQRTISSKQTFFMKIVFPAFWIFFLGIGVIQVLSGSSAGFSTSPLFILLVWIGGSTFLYWFVGSLKKVSIFGDFLYVSNYLKEIQIPLSEIHDVTENVWLNIHPVTIHLKNPSEFGSKIVFMPTFRFFAFWSSHPIVSELRELVTSRSSKSNFNRQF